MTKDHKVSHRNKQSCFDDAWQGAQISIKTGRVIDPAERAVENIISPVGMQHAGTTGPQCNSRISKGVSGQDFADLLNSQRPAKGLNLNAGKIKPKV